VLSPEQLAELARKLREQSPDTPEREAYLDRLAAEIREGRYEIDTETLARTLIEKLDLSESD
jgi:anti-sigma28 factor (negative regulator of flagellin synthesis)